MHVEEQLNRLERDGFILIPGALSPEEIEKARVRLNHGREQGCQEGLTGPPSRVMRRTPSGTGVTGRSTWSSIRGQETASCSTATSPTRAPSSSMRWNAATWSATTR